MARKRIIHILNWEKWQARSDKELPWLKLWGRLFKTPWFQFLPDDQKFCTIVLLDLARQFGNKIDEELVFNGYLKGNYGLSISDENLFKLCKVLIDNKFLSDNCQTEVRLEGDKIREDKIRQEGVGQTVSDTDTPILYLNEKTGRKFSPKNKANIDLVKARFAEGRTLEDFKVVIDKKAAAWMTDEKMASYLRPETLFSRSHFESYLNEPEKKLSGKEVIDGIFKK